jgi:hypothetical protein
LTTAHRLILLHEYSVVGLFFITILFAFVYGCTFTWWETWTGRALLVLDIAFVFAQLRDVLVYWHVIPPVTKDDTGWLTWVAGIAPGVAGVAVGVLIWRAVHNLRRNPETATTPVANYLLRLGSNHVDRRDGGGPGGNHNKG